MEIITRNDLQLRFEEFVTKIMNGAIFIHPTDTIYGIGCNALNATSVKKVREIKNRKDSPFSVWVPSLEWIKENCLITKNVESWLEQLPGPYTLILNLNNNNAVSENVAPNKKTLGIRLPEHWFSKVIQKCNLPIITTSANVVGEPFMTSLENLNPEIKKHIEFMIYEGEKKARPSKIVNVEKEEVVER